MKVSTAELVLDADSGVDLQIHTTSSDGKWQPEQLVDHLLAEEFGLAAITDHDRVDTAASLQQLASDKGLPILVATEMTTTWHGDITDILCYGFDPEKNALGNLAHDILRRQTENTGMIIDRLKQRGFMLPTWQVIDTVLAKPSAQQIHDLIPAFHETNPTTDIDSLWNAVVEAGFRFIANHVAAVVEACHADGGVCLIAHPGRGDDFTKYDSSLLDQFRSEVPIDGLEAYYPAHTPEQIAEYVDYADKYNLFVSAGSDSHGPNKKPVKYRADLIRKLLERVGVQVK